MSIQFKYSQWNCSVVSVSSAEGNALHGQNVSHVVLTDKNAAAANDRYR